MRETTMWVDEAGQRVSPRKLAEIKQSLRRAMQRRIESNLLPYAGQWVTRPVLEQKLREERVKARVRALELMILYVASALVSLLMISLFWYLCY